MAEKYTLTSISFKEFHHYYLSKLLGNKLVPEEDGPEWC